MSYYIGMVGSLYSELSEKEIREKLNPLLNEALIKKKEYEDIDYEDKIYLVYGLIRLGVPKVINKIAEENKYFTVGIGPKEAEEFFKETYNEDVNYKFHYVVMSGEKYGDENRVFINNIDVLICVDGSEQDFKKVELAKSMNIPIIS